MWERVKGRHVTRVAVEPRPHSLSALLSPKFWEEFRINLLNASNHVEFQSYDGWFLEAERFPDESENWFFSSTSYR